MAGRSSIAERRREEIRTEGTAIPLGFEELEAEAIDAMPPAVARFATSGAGTGGTVRANCEAFDRWRIAPRVFRDVTERDLRVDLFGQTMPVPLFLAPIGGQAAYHEQGELAVARAAAALDVPFSLSTVASYSIEDVAEVMGPSPRLFQLYWTADWEVTASLVSRAEAAGYDGILLTVDFQAPRWTPRTLADTDDSALESAPANLTTDPVASRVADGETNPFDSDRSVTWDDLAFLREHTDLPIYVKGISHPDDAELAVRHGADGVVVSNHGGRQLDGGVGAVTVLPDVVDVVDGEIPVLFDSGIRRGSDVFKAIALGADAVFLGRPFIYGLAVAGERGAYEAVHNVLAEFDSVLGQAGCASVADVTRRSLVER